MGHFIYRFHHQSIYSSKKKKISENFLEQATGLFMPVEGNKAIICLNSAHTEQKIFLMGPMQKLSQFPYAFQLYYK